MGAAIAAVPADTNTIRGVHRPSEGQTFRAAMSFASIRMVVAAAGVATLFVLVNTASAQNGESKAGGQRPQGEAEAAKKVDEFAEAARHIVGPAGQPECVWLGRRAVSLLIRDDLDTAFRHMELYDRFGCPASHIQAAFRCLVRQGPPDLKAPEKMSAKVHACWINPEPEPSAPPPTAAAPTTTTNR